ncbi:MAG TPA: hypothetical protein IAC02_09825 [Candidatus Coprovivens excrementavium]|nr:hypothetical protein [Candidatus Coprovivens excrementavium]
MELVILLAIAIFVLAYRYNTGDNVYKFFADTVSGIYNTYAPYSYREVKEKTKELGYEYTPRQYMTQVLLLGGAAGVISFLYFYSVITTIVYVVIAICFVPYLNYLRTNRIYSEYIFEQIQVYTTNVIMEFTTTQSFVKALEGVRDSGILQDPVLRDVKRMIQMAYENGTIDQSIEFFDTAYPYYMVKNMHQLFLQITKEGARDSGEALELMSLDIDALVEGVYRDRMDRQTFHKKFLTFGGALFLLVLVMQLLFGRTEYLQMLEKFYVKLILHAIIIINCYFLITGEKFYNEDVGVE